VSEAPPRRAAAHSTTSSRHHGPRVRPSIADHHDADGSGHERPLVSRMRSRTVLVHASSVAYPHLGHPTEPPRPAPARSREQFDFD